jgi:hypothetical protein
MIAMKKLKMFCASFVALLAGSAGYGWGSEPAQLTVYEVQDFLAERRLSPATQSSGMVSPPGLLPALSNTSDRQGVSTVAFHEPTVEMPEAGVACLPPPDVCECCPPVWCHRNGVFADLLYLRAGNIDYVYAVEQTGPLPADTPTGPVGRVNFDGAAGYRLGFNYALSDCSSIQTSYTWFQDNTQSVINANPGNVLIFQPGHPSLPNAGFTSVQASASYDIRFQQVDIDYRSLLWGTDNTAVNYFAGLRYANLKQQFRAQEDVGAPAGLTAVQTDIDFDGFGIGFGIDGLRRSNCTGLLIYSRASASFVAGEFQANYLQTTQFLPGPAAGNNLEEFRVVTILQAELGTGWQSLDGRYLLTAGFQFTGWSNSLTTGSYISGVQTSQFNNLNETIFFDGLVTRFQINF